MYRIQTAQSNPRRQSPSSLGAPQPSESQPDAISIAQLRPGAFLHRATSSTSVPWSRWSRLTESPQTTSLPPIEAPPRRFFSSAQLALHPLGAASRFSSALHPAILSCSHQLGGIGRDHGRRLRERHGNDVGPATATGSPALDTPSIGLAGALCHSRPPGRALATRVHVAFLIPVLAGAGLPKCDVLVHLSRQAPRV